MAGKEFCPCGSGRDYQLCCASHLAGRTRPTTPAALMRSRYTAFCRGNIDYLIATHHPSTRQANDRQTLRRTIATTTWLSLRILSAAGTSVEFVAFFRDKGTVQPTGGERYNVGQLHERSQFVQEGGRWYYLQGLILPRLRLARNDPCWCGSGKELKQCHSEFS